MKRVSFAKVVVSILPGSTKAYLRIVVYLPFYEFFRAWIRPISIIGESNVKHNIIVKTSSFKFTILSIFIIGISCTKQIEINLPDYKQEYGVNCLFSPEKPIQLFAFRTSSIADNVYDFTDDFNI